MTATRSTYSVKLREALDGLRPSFQDMSEQLTLVGKRRKEIAPAFVKAWNLWTQETRRPFVAFVHELDASLPVTNRKAYRVHPAYRAARYLQDLAKDPDHARRRGLTPMAMLAVTIKSIRPLCGTQRAWEDAVKVLLAASKWREQDRTKLVNAIAQAKSVGLPGASQLVDVRKSAKMLVANFERERLSA